MHYRRWRLYGDVGPATTTYGQGSYTPFGYRLIYANGKQRFEHRIIMERILGRPLRRDEEVHHKDGAPWNNDPSNLVVLSSAEHHAIHSRPHWGPNGRDCASCKRFLPISEFYMSRGKPTSYCRECHRVKVRASRINTGRGSLACDNCGAAISGFARRCHSCAVRSWKHRTPPPTCRDCGCQISKKKYLRCQSCGRKALLKRRPDLIPSKQPDSGHFAAHG